MTETTSRNGDDALVASDDEPTEADITRITKTLRATFRSGRTRSAQWRADQLSRLAQMMTDNEAAIIDALSADLGRAPFESWLTDIAGTVAEARYAAKHVRRWMRRDRRMLELPPVARTRLGRVRALRDRPDHRNLEPPVPAHVGARHRRHRGRKHRLGQAFRIRPADITAAGGAGSALPRPRCGGRGRRRALHQRTAARAGVRSDLVYRRSPNRPEGPGGGSTASDTRHP